jgi:hypothetical protein
MLFLVLSIRLLSILFSKIHLCKMMYSVGKIYLLIEGNGSLYENLNTDIQ